MSTSQQELAVGSNVELYWRWAKMWYHVDSKWPSGLLLVYVRLEVWYKSNVQILNGHARWQCLPPGVCRALCRPPIQRPKKSYAQV